MSHTEEFNKIMQQHRKEKKPKQQPVKEFTIEPGDNMNAMQTDLSKCTYAGNVVRLPFEQLPNYSEVRKALLNAGASYNRSTFIFPNDAKPYIDRLMGGESVNIKKEFQFFATPPSLADELVRLANIDNSYLRILEPSAGQGAIVKAIYRNHPERNKQIDCCELMDINRSVLDKIEGTLLIANDFLGLEKNHWQNYYDRVIANPPFNKNQDIDHIRKMYEVCKDGGRIVSVASISWRTGSQKKQVAFREWLEELNADIIDVPRGTFKESGTEIPTCIVVINK